MRVGSGLDLRLVRRVGPVDERQVVRGCRVDRAGVGGASGLAEVSLVRDRAGVDLALVGGVHSSDVGQVVRGGVVVRAGVGRRQIARLRAVGRVGEVSRLRGVVCVGVASHTRSDPVYLGLAGVGASAGLVERAGVAHGAGLGSREVLGVVVRPAAVLRSGLGERAVGAGGLVVDVRQRLGAALRAAASEVASLVVGSAPILVAGLRGRGIGRGALVEGVSERLGAAVRRAPSQGASLVVRPAPVLRARLGERAVGAGGLVEGVRQRLGPALRAALGERARQRVGRVEGGLAVVAARDAARADVGPASSGGVLRGLGSGVSQIAGLGAFARPVDASGLVHHGREHDVVVSQQRRVDATPVLVVALIEQLRQALRV